MGCSLARSLARSRLLAVLQSLLVLLHGGFGTAELEEYGGAEDV
jgi:hypothetical protein